MSARRDTAEQREGAAPARWLDLSAALAGFLADDTRLGLTVLAPGGEGDFCLSRTGPDGEIEISFVLSGSDLDHVLPALQRWFARRHFSCTEDLLTDDLLRGRFATRHLSWLLPPQTPLTLFEVCSRLLTDALGVSPGTTLAFSAITLPDTSQARRSA